MINNPGCVARARKYSEEEREERERRERRVLSYGVCAWSDVQTLTLVRNGEGAPDQRAYLGLARARNTKAPPEKAPPEEGSRETV